MTRRSRPGRHFPLWAAIMILVILLAFALGRFGETPEKTIRRISEYKTTGDARSIRKLIGYSKHGDEKIRIEAVFALGAFCMCGCPRHCEKTKISALNKPEVARALLERLQDKSPKVRLAAAASLTVYRHPFMVEPLIEVLDDTSGADVEFRRHFRLGYPVGAYAAYTLGELGDRRAVQPLIKALGNNDDWITNYACDALRELGVGDSSEEIQQFVPLLLTDLQSAATETVIRSLHTAGILKIREAVPIMNELLRHEDPDVRTTTAFNLRRVHTEDSIEPLKEALKDDSPHVRGQAAIALAEMGVEEALPQILKLLDDDEPSVRKKVIAALQAGTTTFPSPSYRERAKEALEKATSTLQPELNGS